VTHASFIALHDLQLLLLQRAWQAPWTPEMHATFHPIFRDAVVNAKSTRRLGFPQEVMNHMCSFLHCDWWEGAPKRSWNNVCLCKMSREMITSKLSAESRSTARFANGNQEPTVQLERYSSHCLVSMYCSESCRSPDLILGHRA
jgi:hypothetical protein